MQIVKIIILLLILLSSGYIGILISKKYINRVKSLKEMKTALNIFNTKIKFTYEPIPQIFKEISHKVESSVGKIFLTASNKMENLSAGEAWQEALNEGNISFTKEDIEVLKNLSNMLGKVDIEGQISEIELVDSFLNKQIELAEEEKTKYVKMYKTLGIVAGVAVVIILI